MHPRRPFPHSVKRAAIARATNAAGIVICECHRVPQLMALLDHKPCGVALVTGHIRFEHIICDEIRKDVSLDNCAVLTTTCWRLKTDRYDLPTIADIRRQSDRHAGIRGSSRPLPGGRSDPRKRTMGGEVVDRETGERWGAIAQRSGDRTAVAASASSPEPNRNPAHAQHFNDQE